MKLTMRATATLGKKVTLITAAFVLAVSTLTAAVPFILSQKANAMGANTVSDITTFQAFKDALNDSSVGYINLASHVTITAPEELVLSRSDVRINGNDSTIVLDTATSALAGWKGDYVFQAYGVSNVEINSLRVSGGDAGFLINGSQVTLKGNTHVDGHEFGGIEVSRGSAAGLSNSQLTLQGALWSEAAPFETQSKPSVWVVDGQGSVNSTALYQTLTSASYVAPGKTYLYRNATLANSVATNTTLNRAYENVASAIADATNGNTVRLDKDVALSQMVFINKPLTFDGNNKTLTASYSYTENGVDNAVVTVTSNDVTLKNLTTNNASSGQKPHGIVVQEVTGINVNNVTLKNGRAGMIVNSSVVTASNIHTSGNGWYGINVDKPGAKLTISGVNTHTETAALWVDNRNDGTIVDVNSKYEIYETNGLRDAYRLDTTAPAVPTHISPSANALQNVNDFWFDWSDAEDATRYELQNSQNGAVDATTGSFQNVQWTGDYQQIQPTESKARSVGASGTWYWQVRSIDAAGNASAWTTPWKVSIDVEAPTAPQLNTPTNNQVFTTNSIPATWTAATDANGINKYQVEYIYDDGHTFTDGPFREVSGSTTSRTHSPSTSEQGGVTIRVRAFDNAGNAGAWSNSVHYYYDNTKPTVSVDSATVTNATKTLDVAVTAKDTFSGVKRIEFNLYDSTNTTMIASLKGQNYVDFAQSKTLTLSGFDVSTLANGTYVIRAAAQDNAGLLSTYATQTIEIDNVAPQVTGRNYSPSTLTNGNVIAVLTFDEAIASITDGWTPADSTNTIFTKTYTSNTTDDIVDFRDAANNAGQTTVTISWIDKAAPVVTSATSNGATVRGTVDFTVNDPDATVSVNGAVTASRQVTGNGTYTIRATDLAGNVSDPYTFTINNAQTVTLDPIDLQSPTPLISGTALWVVDPASVGSVEITIDGNPYAASIDAAGNWSIQVIAPLENGPHAMLVNGQSFSFITSVPASLLTPAITNPAAALGVSDEATSNTDGEGVEGASSENKAAQAVDTDSTDGTVLGLAWYWWLLILAGIALVLWWIIAALRRRQSQDA